MKTNQTFNFEFSRFAQTSATQVYLLVVQRVQPKLNNKVVNFFRPCRGGAAGNIFSPPCNFRAFLRLIDETMNKIKQNETK